MASHEWTNLSISSGTCQVCIKCSIRSYQGIPSECTERWGYPWGPESGKNLHPYTKKNEQNMIDPGKRLLSDPPDEFKPTSVQVRLTGHLVHETIVELDLALIPQNGDWIYLPDGSGRYGKVLRRIYELSKNTGKLTITIYLEVPH